MWSEKFSQPAIQTREILKLSGFGVAGRWKKIFHIAHIPLNFTQIFHRTTVTQIFIFVAKTRWILRVCGRVCGFAGTLYILPGFRSNGWQRSPQERVCGFAGLRVCGSAGLKPADPQTRRPADPQTRRPADPQTRRPADPQTRRPADPRVCEISIFATVTF